MLKPRRDVFQAIADPTRRKIIDLVARKALTINAIAVELKMTQPAISQQVKILRECGVVKVNGIGRERFCQVEAETLVPAFLWLERYQQQWVDRIALFDEYVSNLHAKNKKKKK